MVINQSIDIITLIYIYIENTVPKPIKIRKTWAINSLTRVKESKKVYSRHKLKQETGKIVKNA